MLIQSALQSQEMLSRLPIAMPSMDAPTHPTTLQTYPISANLTIEQLGDTVRYIRGCSAAPPIVTTTYVIMGRDSVRRVSPDPRMFDRYMVMAIRGDMNTASLRMRMADRTPAEMANVPGPPRWPCDRRR